MNKKLLIFGILPTLFLTGCGNKGNVIEKRTNLDPGIAKANAKNIKLSEYSSYKTASTKKFTSSEIYNTAYASLGVLVTKNSAGYIGFYSLLHNKQIIANQYEPYWISYEVIRDENVGFFITINYEDKLLVVDSLGNNLYSGSVNEFQGVQTRKVNDSVYVIVSGAETKYCEYGESKLELVTSIPTQKIDDEEEIYEFNFGDPFVDVNRVSLKNYGYDGYYMSFNNCLLTSYDSNNKPLMTYSIPQNSTGGLVKNKLLIQQDFETSDEAEQYTYISNGEKHVLETWSVDIITGKVESIESLYKITSLTSLKDADGNFNYSLANVTLINEYKILYRTVEYIMDSKLNFVNDVTGESLSNLVNLSNNNFYNTQTQILYDSSMAPIKYLSSINPQADYINQLFTGKYNGKYGAVDFTGKVVIPFENKNILSIGSNIAIVNQDDMFYRYNILTGVKTKIEGELTSIDSGLLLIKDSKTSYRIITEELNLTAVTTEDNSSVNRYTFNLGLDNAKYSIVAFTQSNSIQYVLCTAKALRRYSGNSTIGSEKTAAIHYGSSIEDSYLVKLNTKYGSHYYKQSYSTVYYAYKNTSSTSITLDLSVKADMPLSCNIAYTSTDLLTTYTASVSTTSVSGYTHYSISVPNNSYGIFGLYFNGISEFIFTKK